LVAGIGLEVQAPANHRRRSGQFALIERLIHPLVEALRVTAACTRMRAVKERNVLSCGHLLQFTPDTLGVAASKAAFTSAIV
jgi:hypothetical protein